MLTEGKADAATDGRGPMGDSGRTGRGYEKGDARRGNPVHDGANRCKVDQANLEAAWKHVASQSGRKLGAFVFLYLLEHKTPPPMLRPSDVEFRNAVIHKGKIPAREKAIEFGEQVVQIIMAVLAPLRAQADDLVQRAARERLRKLAELARAENPKVASMTVVTLVCLARSLSEPQPTLREWITTLEKRPRFQDKPPGKQ
ncbi:MAG: hypothetical protein ACYDAE_21805 [Steroidobacteraceae bacterium]